MTLYKIFTKTNDSTSLVNKSKHHANHLRPQIFRPLVNGMTLSSRHHHSIMILYVYLCFICSIHFHDIIITYPSNLYI